MLNCTPMICMIKANNFVERGILIFKFECLQLRDNFQFSLIDFQELRMKHDEIRDKKKLAQWINTYTHTSLLEVYTALSRDSGAIHLIGSFFVFVTSYMSPYVCRNRPKSAIFTALFSPRRMLRAARSRWTNPLPAKYSCLQGKQKLNLAPRASLYPFPFFFFFFAHHGQREFLTQLTRKATLESVVGGRNSLRLLFHYLVVPIFSSKYKWGP